MLNLILRSTTAIVKISRPITKKSRHRRISMGIRVNSNQSKERFHARTRRKSPLVEAGLLDGATPVVAVGMS